MSRHSMTSSSLVPCDSVASSSSFLCWPPHLSYASSPVCVWPLSTPGACKERMARRLGWRMDGMPKAIHQQNALVTHGCNDRGGHGCKRWWCMHGECMDGVRPASPMPASPMPASPCQCFKTPSYGNLFVQNIHKCLSLLAFLLFFLFGSVLWWYIRNRASWEMIWFLVEIRNWLNKLGFLSNGVDLSDFWSKLPQGGVGNGSNERSFSEGSTFQRVSSNSFLQKRTKFSEVIQTWSDAELRLALKHGCGKQTLREAKAQCCIPVRICQLFLISKYRSD